MLGSNYINEYPKKQGLYDPRFEHDACGVGLVASIHGKRSHDILKKGLGCVGNLVHRGAVDADAKSGDGAGILTQLPTKVFKTFLEEKGYTLFNEGDLGVAMIFLPKEGAYEQAHCRKVTEDVVKARGFDVVGWREVPTNPKVMGDKAAATAPKVEQLFILKPESMELASEAFEHQLYLTRREIEKKAESEDLAGFYVCSFSSKTIVYKGMFTATQLERFYADLHNPDFETAVALYHQRYSTNTFPTWALAQPFRMLAHNGEINTIRGNRKWLKAREADIGSSSWGEESEHLVPVDMAGSSDSSTVDHCLELMNHSGRSIMHSLLMMVPAAFRSDQNVEPEVNAFYEYHEAFSEPWDGPAALAAYDGRYVAACLDRNGLRPARYKITQDGVLLLGSEIGVGETPDDEVAEKGRLAPGEMLAIDTKAGKLLRNEEIKKLVAAQQNYGEWVEKNLQTGEGVFTEASSFSAREKDEKDLLAESLSFSFSDEELKTILIPMVKDGKEPLGSMGDDTPLAVLSDRPRPLYHYFRQMFAQVTNPAIDPIREKLVMDTQVFLGAKSNWLVESPDHAKQLRLETPVLTNSELANLEALEQPYLQSTKVSTLFEVKGGVDAFKAALERIHREADEAVASGKTLLILSDQGSDEAHGGVPILLAVASVHQHLIRQGSRMRVSLVCETAEARDVHHYATLIGYGASAINPYLVWDLLAKGKETEKAFAEMSESEMISHYKQSVDAGLLKIMSKMGVSRLASYHGGQLFEVVGLSQQFIDAYFEGTPTFLGGIGIEEVAQETIRRHTGAYELVASGEKVPAAGYYAFKRNGEKHSITPQALQSLHTFVGIKNADKGGKREDYEKFVEAVSSNQPIAIRDLLRFKGGDSIPLDEVEPIEDIRQRFTTAAMSLGAISPEAHETLAIAMNRIDGKSNSGEGGEDKTRFTPMENGDSKNSRIKQVASGRFGVTAEYLASAEEIEIKVAQGAKPGEGGQIPGHKVSKIIARLRHSTPGVMLISPPPHHDIYSIEDLAQLIYDLKQVNPRAKICVKLVAEAGVGTIAAGVAKAHADIILVSGHDGGTAASPLSSVKFAGSPWEIGIAETQQVLLLNDLRNRITLRTDGGFRTGRDVVIGAILGAEEYNFGTSALLALGCVYVRKCHLNTCPVGIATQDDRLRGKYKGTVEGVVEYLNAIAQEVREIMASLGVRKLNDLIGQTQYLEQISLPDHPKANLLDLSALLYVPDVDDLRPRHHTWERNDKLEDRPLDEKILQDAKSALQTKKPIKLKYKVKNVYRCIGTQLSGEIAYRYGDEGLPSGTIDLELRGSAGQSLGVFLVNGVRIKLFGESNDYVGKGMNGGEIITVPPTDVSFNPSENMIIGNTVLYGATGGKLFAYGRAGERFAVRNSGAKAVVEGIGDHGCEYMTNGVVVVLGPTGKNFGAGMSGGVAYVLDEAETLESTYNGEMVRLSRVEEASDLDELKALIQEHVDHTESGKARTILDQWETYRRQFWKVAPATVAAATETVKTS